MPATVGAILLTGITLYAVLAGADFGGGLWDLLAGGDQRGRSPRQLIDQSISPVWEANHVWLIFDLVIFWTAFPRAFAAVMIGAALPLWLAAGGIVLRGAGFAFRKEITRLPWMRAAGATFALSSLMTPFFMGTVIGAIATRGIPPNPTSTNQHAWTNPTAVLAGLLFVAACGYLAAVYLTGEATRRGDRRLLAYFTRRAQAAAVVAGALSLALLAELHGSNRVLYSRLTGRALPLVILAALCGLGVLASISAHLPRFEVRVIAALGVATVIWGWGVAQYPVLLPGTGLTLDNASAPRSVLVALVGVFIAAVLVIGPSLALLFTLQSRGALQPDEAGLLMAADRIGGARPASGPRAKLPHEGLKGAIVALFAAVVYLRNRRRER
ncbi:MAG: cytochrome d ubiquinol oxidase subunit [Acidimicrobiaceae bacterium]|nr:cytochrome d ubiquinol oxidase subunit [Acidimicrobiaceae bacterium]